MTDNAPAPAPADNAPAPAPEPVVNLNPAPSGEKTWRDEFLPEDIRNDPNFTKFESKESFAKSHLNLVKMIGADKIVLPKEGDQAGWEAAYKALGRPDDPKAYGFQKPTELPAGLEYSEEQDMRLATVAHKAGLNKQQAAMVREEFIKFMGEGATAQSEATQISRATQESQLKTTWGRAYDQNLKEAKLAMREYAGEDSAAFIEYLETTGLGNHPAMAKVFHNIARKTMGDDKLIGAGLARENTPTDIEAAIADHTAKHSAALFDASHPEHKLRTQERTRLFDQRYG